MENNIIQNKMDNKVVNCNEMKNGWMVPELEILDGRNTYSGFLEGGCEGEEYLGCHPLEGGS